MYIIKLFFFFSFVGFIFEKIVEFFPEMEFQSGFLNGPWIPIYGFGVLIILGISKFLKDKNLTRKKEIILFFIISTILITILEFIGGHLVYFITGEHFWDYSWTRFNFGRYISLEISLLWGILVTILNYLIYPKIKNFIERIPNYIIYILMIGFIIDLIFTLINA